MKPRRKTNARLVSLAAGRVRQRRFMMRHRERVLAERRAKYPEMWARESERILAVRRTPKAREVERVREVKKRHSGQTTVSHMLHKARQRAKKKGLDFSITAADVRIPERCPLLGLPLFVNVRQGAGPNSPSLDRIKPELGYVPGNVWVVSYRANMIKSNATAEELLRIAVRLQALKVT